MTSLFENFTDNMFLNIGIQKTKKQPLIIKDFKNLGLIYQGTKRQLAFKILSEITKDFNGYKANELYFWDIFGGSGAISFNAMANGFNVFYNEISKDIYAFITYIFERLKSGKKGNFGLLDDEFYNFYDRETAKNAFLDEKNLILRGFLCFMYNFGSKQRFSYFCTSEKEIFKKHGHNLIVFNDKNSAKFWDKHYNTNLYAGLVERFENFKPCEWNAKRLLFSNITLKLEAIKVAEIQGYFKGYDLDLMLNLKNIDLVKIIDNIHPDIPKKKYKGSEKDLKSLQQLQQLGQLQQLQQLGQLQQLERLEQLQQLERLEQLQHFNLDYKQNKINTPKDKTLIYLDPPYINTAEYDKKNKFDYEAFTKWIKEIYRQGYKNIYISEYTQYNSDFVEIWNKDHSCNLNNTNSKSKGKERKEKLFKYQPKIS